MIGELIETIGISECVARALLIKNMWNKETVINQYLEDPDMISKTLHFNPYASVPTQGISAGPIFCEVCYDEKPSSMGMECGHRLCSDCYKDYLVSQIALGPDSIYTVCPVAPCKLIVPAELFKAVLDEEQYQRYIYYYKKSYVDVNKRAKWCPSPGCKYAVEYPSMKQTDIVCKCGNDWCFKCLKKAHRPCSCDMLSKWLERIQQG